MKKETFEKLSEEELKSKIKTVTSILYIMLFVLILYGVYMFYKMFEGTWETGPQIVIPFFLFAAMIPYWVNIKKMKEELQKRKE
jgi:hypothetical protein